MATTTQTTADDVKRWMMLIAAGQFTMLSLLFEGLGAVLAIEDGLFQTGALASFALAGALLFLWAFEKWQQENEGATDVDEGADPA